VTGCGERPIDWAGPENFVLSEKASETENGVQLEYVSLVDAPAQAVYDALADVEHYADFIPGVNRVQLLTTGKNSKTVQIAQRVISQQTNAKVEWTFFPERRRIEFRTLQSNMAYNDGSYEIEPSPDGRRCLVRTTFLVREGPHTQSIPMGVLTSGTHESFLAAAAGVKRRAAGTAG
jgi:ribosome-associated toxin RatA of RatAB toxin-antitoxin module